MPTSRRITRLLWIGVLLIVVAWTIPKHDWELFGKWWHRFGISILAAVAVPLTATLLHELGHAVVALVTGHRLHALYSWFPMGPLHFRVFGTWVVLGPTIRGGMCHTLSRDPARRPTAWIHAAGPLANGAVAVLCIAIWLGPASGFWAEIWCLVAAGYNLVVLGINLWPHEATVLGTPMHTDGYVLRRRWEAREDDLFMESAVTYGRDLATRGDLGRAELHLRRALARNPESPSGRRILAMVLLKAGKLDDALRLMEALPGVKHYRAMIHTLSERHRDADRAEALSREAMEENPSDASVQAVRGLVLGEEGLGMLRRAYQAQLMPEARGRTAAFLARVADSGEREKYLRKAGSLGAEPWVIAAT